MYGQKYSRFYAAYNESVKAGNPNSRQEIIGTFTNGRTESIKELSEQELAEIIEGLEKLVPANNSPYKGGEQNEKANRMRKAIIAIFYSMNKTVQDAKDWAEKQGVKGIKKKFNDYTTGDLYVLITIAEKIKADWQKSIRKQVTQKFEHEQ